MIDSAIRPASPADDGLAYTGRIAGGLRSDLARRRPFYLDDFRQGLDPKVLASILFLFFACLANAIASGSAIAVTPGTLLHRIVGATEMRVNSAHHQAVRHPGPRAIVNAIAPDQVIVEISGQEKKIESFIDLMRPFGIVELVRTGRIAMVRGVVRPANEASSLRKVAGAKA